MKEPSITAQAVGAYGEKVVEAELLRNGWIPSNVNASVKNAVDFDIFALKNKKFVQIRVKTCSAKLRAFQFGFKTDREIVFEGLSEADFTILVEMGKGRGRDNFYIVPTKVVRKAIHDWRIAMRTRSKRDGSPKLDLGHYTLRLADLRSKEERENYGFERKWKEYLERWDLLDGSSYSSGDE